MRCISLKLIKDQTLLCTRVFGLFYLVCMTSVSCSGTSKKINKECKYLGEQCRIETGVLGVCTPDDERGTLTCVPQH